MGVSNRSFQFWAKVVILGRENIFNFRNNDIKSGEKRWLNMQINLIPLKNFCFLLGPQYLVGLTVLCRIWTLLPWCSIFTLISVLMRLNPRRIMNHYQNFPAYYSYCIGNVHNYLAYKEDPSTLFQRSVFHSCRQNQVYSNRPYSYSRF